MDSKQLYKKTFTGMRISRWKHPDRQAHLWGLVQGFAEITDGLVTLLSLGFFMSNTEMQIAYHRGFSHHLRNKKKALSQFNKEE